MKNTIKCTFFLMMCQTLKCSNDTKREKMIAFVVGGDQAAISNYPHAIYLMIVVEGKGYICGSSIINQWMMLTAAHCIDTYQKDRRGDIIKVIAGTDNLKEVNILRTADKIVYHKDFDESTLINDIGLIRVDKYIPLGKKTKRIIIRRTFPTDTVSLNNAYVAGWGCIDRETEISSTTLKYIHQKLRSRRTCSSLGMDDGMFCAGSKLDDDDHPAQGDSGSGLIIANSYVGIGIVSYSDTNNYPALLVYTNITYFYEWIIRNTKQMFCGVKIKKNV